MSKVDCQYVFSSFSLEITTDVEENFLCDLESFDSHDNNDTFFPIHNQSVSEDSDQYYGLKPEKLCDTRSSRSFSESTCSSSGCSSLTTQDSKRSRTDNSKPNKNAYRLKHLQLPLLTATLPTNDIRRQYATMFTNTLNSHDFSLFLAFLSKYASHNFVYAQTFNSSFEGNVRRHPFLIELHGLKPAAQYWFNKLQLLPDVVYGLQDTNVHTYRDSKESKVVSMMTERASLIFDVDPVVLLTVSSGRRGACGSKELTHTSNRTVAHNQGATSVGTKRDRSDLTAQPAPTQPQHPSVDMSDINTSAIQRYLSLAPLLLPPEQWFCEAELVLRLDAHKVIQKIEFKLTPKKEILKKIVFY